MHRSCIWKSSVTREEDRHSHGDRKPTVNLSWGKCFLLNCLALQINWVLPGAERWARDPRRVRARFPWPPCIARGVRVRLRFPAGTRAPAVFSPAPLSGAPGPTPGHGRSSWARTPDATGCCRFRPSSLEAAGPFPSPASLKAKRSPGPKVLQRKSGTRLQAPAVGRLCALQETRGDVSQVPEDRTWTTTPDRPRAAPLRPAAARGRPWHRLDYNSREAARRASAPGR